MDLRRKGEDTSRSGFTRNKLLGIFGNVHDVSSVGSNETSDVEPCLYDKNARKLVESALLEVELGKAEAQKILQKMV